MYATLRPIFSLLLGLFFLIVGHGLQQTLIPLRAEAEGWSAFQIGALGSAYYIGFVGGCIATPFVILRSGHIRAFMVLAALLAIAMIAHTLWVAFAPWFILRVLLGASLAGLYMIIESWLNDRASNTNRGFIMSAYIMVNYAALAVGQFLMTLASPLDFTLFAVATIMMALSVLPLALTRQPQPAPVALVRFRLLALYRSSPVGLIGVFAAGLANGAYWSLGAVSAVGHGLSASDAALFMTISTAAGAVAQWPVGRFSDRIDRRLVLAALLAGAIVSGLLLAFLPLPGRGWFVLAVLYGFAIAPTYSIAAAHAYDHAQRGSMVEAAAGLFFANAIGSIAGPLIASTMMQHFGPQMLFFYTAIVHVLLLAYITYRLRIAAPAEAASKKDFAQSAAVPGGAAIAPEPLDPAHPDVATPSAAVEHPAAPA